MYELLTRTSRTFALAIPLLPEPTRRSMCLAYLLFRVADTLEDAPAWSREARLEALAEWERLLEQNDNERVKAACAGWVSKAPVTHDGYRDLLLAAPELLAEIERLPDETRRTVVEHAMRTIRGMSETLEGADEAGNIRFESLKQLRVYCYIVAGIVGELITELFVQDAPFLAEVRQTLVEHQAAFGECLQLVNILKDEVEDSREGRVYLPAAVGRGEVLALARDDLSRARAYIGALVSGGAPAGFVAFTSLAADLADATLLLIERDGAGAKVPRDQVMQLHAQHQRASRTDAVHSPSAQSGK